MYQTVSKSEFRDAFRMMNRQDHFTYYGLGALFDYLEELEGAVGEIELDVVALCCDYAQYSSAVEAASDYDWQRPERDGESDEEFADILEESAREFLQDNTTVIDCEDGIIIGVF